jgi:hypothetical protein
VKSALQQSQQQASTGKRDWECQQIGSVVSLALQVAIAATNRQPLAAH